MKTPSIITFSRRTDPAFFMEWFMDSVKKGGCHVPNPFSGKPYYVSLAPQDVLLLNFWTKNPGAVLPFTEPLLEAGYRTAFFISLTGYPSWLEPAVPSAEKVREAVISLRKFLGRECLWWRYDPVIVTQKIDIRMHIENFKRLCGEVWAGNTERVIVSLAHIDGPYSSIRPLISEACGENSDSLTMPSYERFIDLASAISEIARDHGMELEVCCSPGIKERDSGRVSQGACLSEKHLSKIIPALPRLKTGGTRKSSEKHGYAACGCLKSRDIGTAATCLHGCVYCYANRPEKQVLRKRAAAPSAAVLPPSF